MYYFWMSLFDSRRIAYNDFIGKRTSCKLRLQNTQYELQFVLQHLFHNSESTQLCKEPGIISF
jgi:hypothetical protein